MTQDPRRQLHAEINAVLDALQHLHPKRDRFITSKGISIRNSKFGIKPLFSKAGISALLFGLATAALFLVVREGRKLPMNFEGILSVVAVVAFVISAMRFFYFFALEEPVRDLNELPLSTEKNRAKIKERLARALKNKDGVLDPVFAASDRAMRWAVSSHEQDLKRLTAESTLKYGNVGRLGLLAWFGALLSASLMIFSKLDAAITSAMASILPIAVLWLLTGYMFDRGTREDVEFELWFLKRELEERELEKEAAKEEAEKAMRGKEASQVSGSGIHEPTTRRESFVGASFCRLGSLMKARFRWR